MNSFITVIGMLVLVNLSLSLPECPIVTTRNGKVSGVVTKANHDDAKYVFNYNAIPFAEPPIGERRFRQTTSLRSNWEGVLDGSTPKNAPLVSTVFSQAISAFSPTKTDLINTYSEDCLNLNVHTSNVNRRAKMPVIVWLYGGGYSSGNNQMYDGATLASLQDVVVVFPNYRLNAFGFLSFGKDSILPGNVGLHDQTLALKWVKRNIANFGGDPSNVLLTGESAGSSSVGHQLNSPDFRKLFHKAIFFSGVSAEPAGLNDEQKRQETNNKFYRALGLNETIEDRKLLQTLQSMDSAELLKPLDSLMDPILMNPVVDGEFIADNPRDVIESGKFNKVPSLIFNNNNEGGLTTMFMLGATQGNPLPEQLVRMAFEETFRIFNPNANRDFMFEKIKEFYSSRYLNISDPFFYTKLHMVIDGDINYIYSSFIQALRQSDEVATYMGIGTYQLRLFHDPEFSDGLPLKLDWINADHLEDLFLSTGVPFANNTFFGNPRFTNEEKELSLKFMQMIGNFAKTNNPNEKGSLNPWKPFTAEESNVMMIGLNDMTLEKDFHQDLVEFWSQEFIPGTDIL